MSRRVGHQSGFTLLEILIALLIVLVLIGILFPIVAYMRAKGREASCLSNAKQLGQAMLLYISDYDQRFPYAQNGTRYWPHMIFSYCKTSEVFVCPSLNVPHVELDRGLLLQEGFSPAYATYIYNIHIGGVESSRALRPDKSALNLAMSAILHPANTVLLADGSSTPAERVSPLHWKPKPLPPPIANILADAYYTGVTDPQFISPGAPRALHGDKATVLYSDGHAQAKKISEFYNAPEVVETPGKPAGYSPCLDPLTGCLK